MSKHTSHDGSTTIDTKESCITVDGVKYKLSTDHQDDWPCAFTIEVEEFPSIKARLMYEEDYSFCNPRKDRDNLGVMAVFGPITRDYSLGDEEWSSEYRGDEFEIDCPMCSGTGEWDERWTIQRHTPGQGYVTIAAGTFEAMDPIHDQLCETEESHIYFQRDNCPMCKGNMTIQTDVMTYVKEYKDAVVALPIYIDPGHGANNGWCRVDVPVDDATNAVIYIDKNDWIKEYGSLDNIDTAYTPEHARAWGDDPPKNNREAAMRLLTSQVEEYDDYMRGECYWISVTDDVSGHEESCGGYLGSEYAEESLYWEIGSAIQHHIQEVKERTAMAERDIITVGNDDN